MPPRAARRRGWSTRTSSRSGRCAGYPTLTRCSRPVRAATRSGSTPSPPAARSPGRWSASTVGCSTRRGCGSATARPCCGRSTRSVAGTGLGAAARRGLPAAAAEVVGQGSADFAPHVKGMEMPGYEPRTLHAMALGLAVNARGADHNRSGAYEADLPGGLDRIRGSAEHVRRGDRDRGPRRGHGLADPVQVPARGVHRAVRGVGTAAVDGHRLGRRRRRTARDRTTHRAGQARLQPPGGLDPRRRLAARAVPRQPARARVRSYGDTARRPAAHHDRQLTTPNAAWTRRAGRSPRASLRPLQETEQTI